MFKRNVIICTSFLLFLIVLIGTAPVVAQDVQCQSFYTTYFPQEYDAWCAFACLEFLSSALEHGHVKCDFINVFCGQYPKAGLMDIFDCGSCCGFGDCTRYYPTLAELKDVMNGIGFATSAGGYVSWWSPPADKKDFYDEICLNNFIFLAYVTSAISKTGHGAVIADTGDMDGDLYSVMDPGWTFTIEDVTWYEINNGDYGSIPAGSTLRRYMTVGQYSGLLVSIDDIAGLWYESQDYSGMLYGYRLSSTANPDDSLAVYVSDNPWGPARLIQNYTRKPLSSPPPSEGIVKYFTTSRGGYADYYYYYIDFDVGNFEEVRPIDELFPCVEAPPDCPTYWDGGGDPTYLPRPVFDAPSNLTAIDVPQDLGMGVELTWELSDQDSLLHHYKIYRDDGIGVFRCIAIVPPGTTTFTDEEAFGTNTYVISAGHHGGDMSQSILYGYSGIWNDFSAEVTGIAVHNYALRNLSVVSAETLFVCPQGDEDTLRVEFEILGDDSSTTVGIPADSLIMYAVHGDTTYFCSGHTVVSIRDTDMDGKTEFIVAEMGGCGLVKLIGHIKGTPLFSDTVTVVIKSPDMEIGGYSRGYVELLDYAEFGQYYCQCGCGSQDYNWLCDYNNDCEVDIIDFSMFSQNYLHHCP